MHVILVLLRGSKYYPAEEALIYLLKSLTACHCLSLGLCLYLNLSLFLCLYLSLFVLPPPFLHSQLNLIQLHPFPIVYCTQVPGVTVTSLHANLFDECLEG